MMINHLMSSSLLDVIAEETDNKLIEFAIGGICNCCLGNCHYNDLPIVLPTKVM
jgi:hypothetical protein